MFTLGVDCDGLKLLSVVIQYECPYVGQEMGCQYSACPQYIIIKSLAVFSWCVNAFHVVLISQLQTFDYFVTLMLQIFPTL